MNHSIVEAALSLLSLTLGSVILAFAVGYRAASVAQARDQRTHGFRLVILVGRKTKVALIAYTVAAATVVLWFLIALYLSWDLREGGEVLFLMPPLTAFAMYMYMSKVAAFAARLRWRATQRTSLRVLSRPIKEDQVFLAENRR